MGNFRAVRGKGANMYYMFKDEGRRQKFKASNRVMGITGDQ